ncbi:DegT/DnrJ/EryC1/StrS family aminotransferase [bacterium]
MKGSSIIYSSKPSIGRGERNAVMHVLKSGMLASGPKVKEFEEAFCKKIGVKNAVAVSSGTTALHTALLALGIGKGDKVLTTPFSFIASSNAVLFTGAKPVFCDIDPTTFNMDTAGAEAILKKEKIKAILVVHLYGLTCDMTLFKKLAKKYGTYLVEDCAQAIGASYKEQRAGTIGDIGCFSLYATKNVMSAEGGIVATNNKKLADKVRGLINHGRTSRFKHGTLGYNFRMTDIQAAIAKVQLNRLTEFTNKRRQNAKYFNKELKHVTWLSTPYTPKECYHVFHQYVILVPQKERDDCVNFLNNHGIQATPIYPMTIPEQSFYKKMKYKTLPIAKKISRSVVCLPVHPQVTKNDLKKIVTKLKRL